MDALAGECRTSSHRSTSTPQETIVRLVNIPAAILAGWHYPLRSRFTIDGAVEALLGRANHRSSVLSAFLFICLIFFQWLLVGAHPLVRPRHRWLEPAVLITFCALLSACLLYFFRDDLSYQAPLLLVFGAWLVWLCLVLLKLFKLGWRSVGWRRSAA